MRYDKNRLENLLHDYIIKTYIKFLVSIVESKDENSRKMKILNELFSLLL